MILSNNIYGHQGPINWLEISSDDYYLLSGSKEAIVLWECNSGKVIKKINIPHSTSSKFLPQNNLCLISTDKGSIILYSLQKSIIIDEISFNDPK